MNGLNIATYSAFLFCHTDAQTPTAVELATTQDKEKQQFTNAMMMSGLE